MKISRTLRRSIGFTRLAWRSASSFGKGEASYRPPPDLHFELVPLHRAEDGTVNHNTAGFRGPEFSREKAAGAVRIVCLGESTTYCTGLADHETWPARLQVKLQQGWPTPVEVINAGVPAYVSSEVLLNYIFKVETLAPDWIIYYFTMNDVRPRQLGKLSRDYREYCRLWGTKPKLDSLRSLETYLRFGKSINYAVRNMLHVDHAESNILNTNSAIFYANVQNLAALATTQGVRTLVVCPRYRKLTGTVADLEIEDPMSWAVAQHRAAATEIAQKFGQPIVDMIDLMPPPPWNKNDQDDFYFDSTHMKARGAELFAEHIEKKLRPLIHNSASSTAVGGRLAQVNEPPVVSKTTKQTTTRHQTMEATK